MFSTRINKPSRAGRAPYNFVPLPQSARWLEEPKEDGTGIDERPPAMNRYDPKLWTGEIRLRWTALSDFYIRGMHDLNFYLKFDKSTRPAATQPFQDQEKLRIPGSTQKGMVRSLIEIVAEAPLGPVNDSQLFFRAVGSVADPDAHGASYEPNAKTYKDRVFKAEPGSTHGVQVGYLYATRSGWYIRPARRVEGLQCFQVKLAHRPEDLFKNERYTWKKAKRVWFEHQFGNLASLSETKVDGWQEGNFICTGTLPKKRSQWILCLEDKAGTEIKIDKTDVEAYFEGGVSQEIKKHGFDYAEKPIGADGVPCFYIQWEDAERKGHVTFGHTHFLRIPYVHTLRMAIPEKCSRKETETRWDLAQAMFGRTEGSRDAANPRTGARGRIFFEDAVLVKGPSPDRESQPRSLILGNPKPTTYQHYAVQTSENVKPVRDRNGRETSEVGSIHWDGDYKLDGHGTVRGWKRYWHRLGAAPKYQPPGGKEKESASKLCPAKKDCVFESRLRFENLRDYELGALLTVLELPQGCAHKLGMAKPHGFGSFQVDIIGIESQNREQRYRRFFASEQNGAAQLETGAVPFEPEDRDRCWNAFAAWVLRKGDGSGTWADLWATPRMVELGVMLRIQPMLPDWVNRTRYLEIERFFNGKKRSEYNNIGSREGEPQLEVRRPLPPASQVFSEPLMPSDALPPPVQNRY